MVLWPACDPFGFILLLYKNPKQNAQKPLFYINENPNYRQTESVLQNVIISVPEKKLFLVYDFSNNFPSFEIN